tara:strand:+ start:174 stop:797 length:624 start_codon:yes stop_codon:yes gene_type:complete
MSTLKTTALRNPSSSTDNIVLNSNGTVVVGGVSSSGGGNTVQEILTRPCDGGTVTSANGTITFPNVTAVQTLTSSYVDVTGSSITYQPPAGTHTVIYRFQFHCTRADADTIGHYRFDVGSYEVVYARHTQRGEDFSGRIVFTWPIKIGGTTNYDTGALSTWTSPLTLKMRARRYNGTYDQKLHVTDNWDGAGTDMFSMPILSLTAIG